MNLVHTLLLATIGLMLSVATYAADPKGQQKYCGSGFTEKLVPEAPFGCQMSGACKAHDACYGKCDEGGELFGKPYCLQSEFSATRIKAKLACESKFYSDIDKSNEGRWSCKGLGALYVAAVGIGGQGPFNGRQIQLASMEDLILTSNSTAEIKLKTVSVISLSQKGLIDLQQMKRVQDRIEFSSILKDGVATTPAIQFEKGLDLKSLKKLQLQQLGKQTLR